MDTGFTVEGARSKRVVEQDQPVQQPMRARQPLRRNPTTDQKKARRAMQRKTAGEDRKGHSITCPQCGATDLRTSVHPDGSRLDAYCDNCHWRGTKIRKKESSVNFNQREAEILTAMERAPLAEQQRLAAELSSVRAQRTAALEAEREIDVSAAVIRDHLTPVPTHTLNTTATDWLDDAEDESPGDAEAIVQAMKTEASMWFGRVGAEVKADREEFAEQAQGMARHQASRFGMGAPIAQRAFLDHVAHLHKAAGDSAVVVEPLPDSAPGPQNDQTTPWDQRVTTGDTNTDASSQKEDGVDDAEVGNKGYEGNVGEDEYRTSSLRAQAYASHQTHSLISQSALRHLADDSPGQVDEDQSGNAESTITDYDTLGEDPEAFDTKQTGPLTETGPYEVPSTRAPNVQGNLMAEGEYKYVQQRGDKWVITQKGTGKVLSTHDSEDKAKASFRAMMQSKHGGSLRSIAAIAAEIPIESVPEHAKPYLAAMDALHTIADRFGADDGATLVRYFLANAPGLAQEAELRTHVAMTLAEARAAKAQFLAELAEVTAADPQSGEAVSHDAEVEVGNPNDRPMWPWELAELPGGTDGSASNVDGTHTPGQEVADYPQPKQGGLSVHAGFPLCAAGCNRTLSAADVLVNTTAGLAHASCMDVEAGGGASNFGDKKAPPFGKGDGDDDDDDKKEGSLIDAGRADPFVSSGTGGGEHCRHCGRPIVNEGGTWIDPEAPATPEEGDDYIWRETCDSSPEFTAEHEPASKHTAGNPHGVGTSQWFDWNDRVRAGERPEGSGPHASDIPGGGIPLHGPLSEEQERWLHPPRHERRMIDQEGKPYPRESALEPSDPAGWYIIEDGKESGPFTDDEKAQMDSGNRHPYTWVRHGSLQAEAGRMSERSGACADGDHDACKMSHGPGPDQCHCPYHGANTKPNKGRQHYSGACAAGDHGSCKMKHGNGPDECACPYDTHHTSSLQTEAGPKDKYKIVPSHEVGYGPGKHVVRKWYPDMKLWFDVGDPHDTREEAEEHMRNQQKESVLQARRVAALAGIDQYGLHKAEPSSAADEERRAGYCKTCNQHVHRAPGGHGPVWVHTDGGMILGNEHGGLKGKQSVLQSEATALEGDEWYQYMPPNAKGMGWFDPAGKAALEGSDDFEEGATWRRIPPEELAGFNDWHAEQARAQASLQTTAIRHYTHEELSKYPTIEQGHMEDLKLNTGTHKYWLSRMTKEDGEPYEHTIHVERHDDKTGGWTHHESYDGDNPSGKRASLDTEAGVIGNSVSTHDLREGDTIVNHGMVLLLEDRKEYNGSGGGASERDQPTVSFKGKCLNMEEFAPGGSKADSFIYHFLQEDGGYWTVQGNKLATWWRIGKNSKLASFRARVGAFVQRAALDTEASYYVHRKRGPRPDYGENDPPREGWVGPIRSPNQAEKERKAWEEAGHQAEVHPSSPEVRKRVRDWQKSVREQRQGSLQATAAPDGDRSFCRICGRDLEAQGYIWYALKNSPPKRDVAEHYCLPARRPGANWPGEFNAEGELVPGTPKDGGIYDAGAKLVPIQGSIDQAKLAAFRQRVAEGD